MRRRRLQLGLSIDQAAELARISAVTWSRVEQGKPVRELSYSAVDRALGVDGDATSYVPPEGKPPAEPRTARELKEILDADPELAEAVYNLVRTAQRMRSGQPVEEEEPQRKDERRRGRGAG